MHIHMYIYIYILGVCTYIYIYIYIYICFPVVRAGPASASAWSAVKTCEDFGGTINIYQAVVCVPS